MHGQQNIKKFFSAYIRDKPSRNIRIMQTVVFKAHSVTVFVNIQLGMLHADKQTNIIVIESLLILLSTLISNI
jgi:hypothetical protein